MECGHVYKHNGSDENALYLVHGNVFTQCDDSERNFNDEDEIQG